MMGRSVHRVSFHDPDGSVYMDGGRVLRGLSGGAAARVERFLSSDAGEEQLRRGRLPASRILGPTDSGSTPRGEHGLTWFEHERLPFLNYPHEWLPEQLGEACALTLDMAAELRGQGWDLKDGNARNIVFKGGAPVFVDFGSIVERDDRSPIWRPAGQIQRHFLLPLLARRRLGLEPADLHLARPDGLSHEEAWRLFSGARLTDRHVFWLCTVPNWLARWARPGAPAPRTLDAELCRAAADRTIASLRRRLQALIGQLQAPRSAWSGYEAARDHYRPEELALKRQTVERWLSEHAPREVLDVGANGGEFSNLAADRGANVVSIDLDCDALRVARAAAVGGRHNVLHLRVDFTAPTPAMGWDGAECQSFDERCAQRFDLVMMLAVMHHVLVSGRIPLDEMLRKVSNYTRDLLVLEYVDPRDSMFSYIARERASDFSALDESRFQQVLGQYFQVLNRVDIVPQHRALYLCRRKPV